MPNAKNIIKVELVFYGKIVGKQKLSKTLNILGGYTYIVNGRKCGREEIYTILLSAGFPPGNPYFEIFLKDDPVGTAANKDTEKEAQENDYDKDLKADIYIVLDNRSKALDLTEDVVTFSKKHNSSAELEYFITGVQCRTRDMREIFAGAGIKQGTPVYDVLLDE
ncbi:MAG: hypothetical protein Q7R35_19750 [Elusimicrobiota bacterium]|nr:hypothetical protein [Elusimicrobiota bacterium]